MEGITEPKVIESLLEYEELKQKMREDTKILFEKLQTIDKDKSKFMKTIIEDGKLDLDKHRDMVIEIQKEMISITDDFIAKHYEEYDLLNSYCYHNDTKKFFSIVEIEQKHKGVGLHAIAIEFGETPQDFKIERIIHV